MKIISLSFLYSIIFISVGFTQEVRQTLLLDKEWYFSKGDFKEGMLPGFSHDKWEKVIIPHDWAIYGPFDEDNDLQEVAITQNLETKVSRQTGRTGGLPYMGVGWYRKIFDVDKYKRGQNKVKLIFDGAMSEARIFVNGTEIYYWPNGYNSFHVDITEYLHNDGKNNLLAVRLENKEQSSRWYPGAGLYRNVHLIVTQNIHVPVWGTFITTPFVSDKFASVNLKLKLNNVPEGESVRVKTVISDIEGNQVVVKDNFHQLNHGTPFEQNFNIEAPDLWSPETPHLYQADSKVFFKNELVDEYTTRFGIRDIKYIADKGFFLNGTHRKFKGVCNHHDLGALGTAINEAALRRRLVMLKDMGCDAIRTAHYIPSPELVSLCDELGFMMIVESFDEWDIAKCKNGYHRFFDDWAEKDMMNMIHHFRNNPCVVMWSIGNEVPTQCEKDGYKVAKFLQDICHREDPTRPVTCGMDQVSCVLDNGFAALLDIPGFNYRVHRYEEAYKKLPQNLVLGSETSSTVSSRGVYKFPLDPKANAMYDDNQSSSYDVEYCWWSNLPDQDFAMADDFHWTLGQFVWTGFDYLGEPTPYSIDSWPNHSSMFGIIDLATIPKDRYYLYRSIWNENEETLHVIPHWTWPGKEGDTIPVFVYTNYPKAELYVNGISYGIKKKTPDSELGRYRLIWDNVIYEPGEIKIIAFNKNDEKVAEKAVKTAGKPYKLELVPDRTEINADGKDLAYINVRIVDKNGTLCPGDQRLVHFETEGAGVFRASANGDPTCLDLFHLSKMHLFNGQLTAIVQASEKKGKLLFKANAKGVKDAKLIISTN